MTERCRNDDESASANNKAFIEYWTPLINKLNDGVPELSPSENKWLDTELLIGGSKIENSRRWIDAMLSKEMKLRDLKNWTNSMATTLKYWEDKPESWLSLIHYFLRSSTSNDMVELVTMKKISKEIIPYYWIYNGLDPNIINQRRMYYADMIAQCNLVTSIKLDSLSSAKTRNFKR